MSPGEASWALTAVLATVYGLGRAWKLARELIGGGNG